MSSRPLDLFSGTNEARALPTSTPCAWHMHLLHLDNNFSQLRCSQTGVNLYINAKQLCWISGHATTHIVL